MVYIMLCMVAAAVCFGPLSPFCKGSTRCWSKCSFASRGCFDRCCQMAWGVAQLQRRRLQVLRASKGAMQLLDMSSHLPSLKRLQGMKKWYGRDKLRYYASWAEAMQVSPQSRGQQLLYGSRCLFGASSAQIAPSSSLLSISQLQEFGLC